VVVLDQHRVIEAEAMVEAAAAAHRVFLQRAQARRGLARADDARSRVRDQPDESIGRGGDARQVSEKIERGALARQDGAGRPLDDEQRRARLDDGAVARVRRDAEVGAERAEHRRDQRQPSDDAALARDHQGGRGRARGNRGGRGDVAGPAQVLRQRAPRGLLALEWRQKGLRAQETVDARDRRRRGGARVPRRILRLIHGVLQRPASLRSTASRWAWGRMVGWGAARNRGPIEGQPCAREIIVIRNF
jgi:hypothetical protein